MEIQDWKKGYDNTKTFKVGGFLITGFINGCKTCNDINMPSFTTEDRRQQIGNCYQTLTVCGKCKNPIVVDDYKMPEIEAFNNRNDGKYKIIN